LITKSLFNTQTSNTLLKPPHRLD